MKTQGKFWQSTLLHLSLNSTTLVCLWFVNFCGKFNKKFNKVVGDGEISVN